MRKNSVAPTSEMPAADATLESAGHFVEKNRKCVWIFGAIAFVLVVIIGILADSIHVINEGNVGIYYRNGALSESLTRAGIHMATPFVTEVVEITIRTETDTLKPVECVTKDGIQNKFYNIQVISSINEEKLIEIIKKFGKNFKMVLVHDRISEEIRTFCASHTIDQVYNTEFLDIVPEVRQKLKESITRLGDDGIQIFNLVVPKPDIPPDIANNYKQVNQPLLRSEYQSFLTRTVHL